MSTDNIAAPRRPLFLTDEDVATLSNFEDAMTAIRAAYIAAEDERRTPGRIFADSSREWMRIMPSIPASGQLFGAKSIVGSFASGLNVSYLISLFDKDTAELAALIDGNRVTGLRTASTTAVGVSTIVPTRPISVGIIGSGFEARSHLEALAQVAEFSSIRVFSPTAANRDAFSRDFQGFNGAEATAVSSSNAAAEGADLVLCAARSRDETPIVDSESVGENTTVVSIGSTTAGQRELPVELIARATTIVVDTYDEVVHDSGDMIAAQAEGIELEDKVISIGAALRAETPIDSESGVRIYKSTGSGLQDIVVAEMLFNRACAQGIGTQLPVSIVTSKK